MIQYNIFRCLLFYGLKLTILFTLVGCSKSGYVLHRSGNPATVYIAKFDGMKEKNLNRMSCEEIATFVRTLSPETGAVTCSPEP